MTETMKKVNLRCLKSIFLQAWSTTAGHCLQNGPLSWREWVKNIIRLFYPHEMFLDFKSVHLQAFPAADERERMTKFYKARGLEVPSQGEEKRSVVKTHLLSQSNKDGHFQHISSKKDKRSEVKSLLLPVLQCWLPPRVLLWWGGRRRTAFLSRSSPFLLSWMSLCCWSLLGKKKPAPCCFTALAKADFFLGGGIDYSAQQGLIVWD